MGDVGARMTEIGYRWEVTIKSDVHWIARLGYLAVAILVGGFGVWAVTVPLSEAVVGPGVIAAAGRNVLVQHLDGGIVRKVYVAEGDRVSEGSALIELDSTAIKTQLRRLTKQWVTLTAMTAQFIAERDGLETLAPVSFELSGLAPSSRKSVIGEQRKEFLARRHRYLSEREILRQREATLEKAQFGLQAQRNALKEQLAIVADELARKKELVDQGLTSRFEYTQIQRSKADLVGQLSVVESEISANRIQIVEAREQIERLASQRVEEAVTRLNEVRTSLADVEEQIIAVRAVLNRTLIRSPVTGVIVSAAYNSPGAVIGPGDKVMEILPTSEELVVDARLRPQDIDSVKIAQAARLRLSALNLRLTPEVPAVVARLSADRLLDEATGEPYFRVELRISDNLPPDVRPDQIYPGMPVEVLIDTGKRTFIEYLIRPLLDVFSRAFREE